MNLNSPRQNKPQPSPKNFYFNHSKQHLAVQSVLRLPAYSDYFQQGKKTQDKISFISPKSKTHRPTEKLTTTFQKFFQTRTARNDDMFISFSPEENTQRQKIQRIKQAYHPSESLSKTKTTATSRVGPKGKIDVLENTLERVKLILQRYKERETQYKVREEAMKKEIFYLRKRLTQFEKPPQNSFIKGNITEQKFYSLQFPRKS